ncbi:MAG: hypothetical protein N2167_09685 [Flavobacteriales bacterium]|nr:hypothetical protein [Flavobacteriales bacterium]
MSNKIELYLFKNPDKIVWDLSYVQKSYDLIRLKEITLINHSIYEEEIYISTEYLKKRFVNNLNRIRVTSQLANYLFEHLPELHDQITDRIIERD